MSLFGWGQPQVSTAEPASPHNDTPTYCIGLECTCGKDCHNNPGYHRWRTGAPTSDEYHSGSTGSLPSIEFDDDQYEYALALLGGQ
jgi:hypothetical protein